MAQGRILVIEDEDLLRGMIHLTGLNMSILNWDIHFPIRRVVPLDRWGLIVSKDPQRKDQLNAVVSLMQGTPIMSSCRHFLAIPPRG